MYQGIKYFQGLNGLRFFAAYLVVIHHIETIRLNYNLFNLKEYSLFNNGGVAVSFFFVLSGFLITYLLLKEQRSNTTISVRRFYLRRILRIWPLYYMLVFIGVVLLPFLLALLNVNYQMPYDFNQVIGYYVFFAPFLVNILFGHHLLEPLWSIGVEEIFYLFWAPLFKFFNKNILIVIISVFVLKIGLVILFNFIDANGVVKKLVSVLQFESMSIGALGAYLLYHSGRKIQRMLVFSIPFQLILIGFIILRLFFFKFLIEQYALFDFLFRFPVISIVILNVVFLWLIINVSLNPRALFRLNNSLLDFLGSISYGVYMYHMLVIFGVVLFLSKFLNSLAGYKSSLIVYALVTSLVIAISFISKKYFEDRFLRLKTKLTE